MGNRYCCLIAIAIMGLVGRGALAAESPPSDPAEAAYLQARACYHELRQSPKRQGQREAWEGCIKQFLGVSRDFVASERAVDAQFTVGKLYEELYGSSKNVEDLKEAVRQFDQFAKVHKRHRLADDAYYRIGAIRWDGFHDKRKAKAAMWRVIRWYPDGDMATEAKKFLREIDAAKKSGRPTGALLQIRPLPVRVAAVGNTPPAPPAAAEKPAVATVGTLSAFHIVIDPGHGGKDAGAIGPGGTREKDVTLSIGKRLAVQLRQQLGCRVSLTRDQDIYLTLDQRNAIATRRRANLFISVHANASTQRTQRGIQTYYLNNASDEASRRLADRENRVAGKSAGEIATIVSTMLQNALTDDSRELAQAVHARLVGSLEERYSEVRDQGVRTALFYVLVGAKSPSILVETSYLSHPQEERRLRDSSYQSEVAAAIASGVTAFVRGKKTVANL